MFQGLDVVSPFSGRQDAVHYVTQDARRYDASEFRLNRCELPLDCIPS
jgi:hypothetical protein